MSDLDAVRLLFRDTIQQVNSADYNNDQVAAWSDTHTDTDKWKRRILEQYFVVAEKDGQVLGFCSLGHGTYLDLLYVHHDHQREGIGQALLSHVIEHAEQMEPPVGKRDEKREITSDVSITAQRLFEKLGFEVSHAQDVHLNGQVFRNYKMKYLVDGQ